MQSIRVKSRNRGGIRGRGARAAPPKVGVGRTRVGQRFMTPPTTDDWVCAVAVPRFCSRNIPSGNDAVDNTSVEMASPGGHAVLSFN
jgi:hypothetical protein